VGVGEENTVNPGTGRELSGRRDEDVQVHLKRGTSFIVCHKCLSRQSFGSLRRSEGRYPMVSECACFFGRRRGNPSPEPPRRTLEKRGSHEK